MKTKVWLSVCIVFCLILVSCNSPTGKQNLSTKSISQDADTLGLVPDFSYEIIPQTPHILIDKVGYLPDRKKAVFILGDDLIQQFSVKDSKTGRVVYEGTLNKVGQTKSQNKSLYLGDFSAFTRTGTYEIYQENVGYSYSFKINKMVYQDVFTDLENEINTYTFTNVSSQSYVLANLMMTKEIYPNAQDNVSFLKQQITSLLDQQDKTTGAVNLDITNENDLRETISLSATAEFAGVLAQYCYNYKEEDLIFAAECLRASQKAYSYMEKYRDNINTDSWYYAATQLYRITGYSKYKNAIKEYDSFPIESRTLSENNFTMLGDIAYLSTQYHTDFTRCQALMNEYLEKAQDISFHSSKENFYVLENIDTISEAELLDSMMLLGIVNYVLSGREYSGIQENYIHYFFGVNEDAINRLTEEYITKEEVHPLENDITKVSEFIFILGNGSSKN